MTYVATRLSGKRSARPRVVHVWKRRHHTGVAECLCGMRIEWVDEIPEPPPLSGKEVEGMRMCPRCLWRLDAVAATMPPEPEPEPEPERSILDVEPPTTEQLNAILRNRPLAFFEHTKITEFAYEWEIDIREQLGLETY